MQKKHSIFYIILSLSLIIIFATFFIFSKNIAWKYFLDKWLYTYSYYFLSWDYNKANLYYKIWDFSSAWKIYEKKDDFKSLYNLWNTFYKIWEQSKTDKKSYYEKSLLAYSWALQIKNDFETKENYDFVKSKLDNLIEDNQNEKNQQNTENDQNTQNQESEQEEKNENNLSEDSENSENQNTENSNQKLEDILSEEEMQQLKQYEEDMMNNQYEYNDYFWKIYEDWQEPMDMFDQLFRSSMFSDFENGNDKKDW